jgi:amino acid transporter
VYLVGFGALLGISTSVLLDQFALARNVYAMASDGLLFRMFAWVNPSTRTPLLASVVFGTIVALMAMLLEYQTLVEFLSIGTLISFTTVAICVIITRYSLTETITTPPVTEPSTSTNHSNQKNENSPIIDRTSEQTHAPSTGPVLRKIFQGYPTLVRFSGKYIFYGSILIIIISSVTMALILKHKEEDLSKEYWVVLSITIGACLLGISAAVFVLSMYEQTNVPSTFAVSIAIFLLVRVYLVMRIKCFLSDFWTLVYPSTSKSILRKQGPFMSRSF